MEYFYLLECLADNYILLSISIVRQKTDSYTVAPMGLKQIMQLADYHTVAAMQLFKSPIGTTVW